MNFPSPSRSRKKASACALLAVAMFWFFTAATPSTAKSKEEDHSEGLIVTVPVTEQEMVQAVEGVVADGIIRGTKEYNKDEYVTGAEPAQETKAFPAWSGPGRAFYKIKKHALDPRNFRESGDSGTLAVRYVVQRADEKSTTLRIDA